MAGQDNIKGKGFDKHPEHINKKGQPRKLPRLDVLLADVLDDAKMKDIITSLYKAAKKGNVKAADVLFDRMYGKAKQSLDITTGDEKINTIKLIRGTEDISQQGS